MSDNSAAIEEMTSPIEAKVWELAGNQSMCIDLGMGRVKWHKPCHSHCPTKVVLYSDYESLLTALHDSINRPKGVVPDSALRFYSPQEVSDE